MFEKLILKYLRHFPIDTGKGILEKRIQLPDDNSDFEFTGSNGTRYLLSFQDHVMRKIYTMGMYERNTVKQLIALAKKDMTFVDVGTNIGAYTLNLAPHVKQCISFEPNPRTLKYLYKNVELNGYKNVTVVPKGLSDLEEELDIHIQSLGSSSFNKHQHLGDSERVSLTTLDLHCERHQVERVDILKIDVEGHEMKVLLGAKETLKRNPKMAVVLELDHNTSISGHTKKDYLDFMASEGFQAYAPKGYPFPLKKMERIPDDYMDNVVFLKGY
ncbi:MAG: FkbM family methyltransferase [Flavobacteriales bacterium]|nr:FkbM family methyltransferase [Flavobacteriales bacterium]